MIKILFFVWLVVSLINLTLKYIIYSKLKKDELFIQELKNKCDKKTMDLITNTGILFLTCIIPILHFIPLLTFSIMFCRLIVNYNKYKETLLCALEEYIKMDV